MGIFGGSSRGDKKGSPHDHRQNRSEPNTVEGNGWSITWGRRDDNRGDHWTVRDNSGHITENGRSKLDYGTDGKPDYHIVDQTGKLPPQSWPKK